MAKFREYIISYGDTLQSISQYVYGDMNRWVEIAEFNDLRYPYIVDTVEEKMRNPKHLKTIGDTLIVRVTEDEQARLITHLRRTSHLDREEIYSLTLGKDLDVMPIEPDSEVEALELKGNDRGGLATVKGIENLKQSLFIRLITPRGSYLGHPNYGSFVHKYLGKKNTEENATLLNIEIERTLKTDGRVETVVHEGTRLEGNRYTAHFSVKPVGIDSFFAFTVTSEGEEGLRLVS